MGQEPFWAPSPCTSKPRPPGGISIADSLGVAHSCSLVALTFAVLSHAACAGGASDGDTENTGTSTQGIANGYGAPEDGSVVGLAVTNENGHVSWTCSGALLAPNLVLTAQHCVARTSDFVNCDNSEFGEPVRPSRVFVTTDLDMWSDSAVWHSGREVLVPPGDASVCGRDIAFVILNKMIDMKTAVPLVPRVQHPAMPHEFYSAIGYGTSGDEHEDAGIRRRRDDLEVTCVGDGCGVKKVDFSEWRGDEGICNGDSGGPALDAANHVIGITSRGPSGCDKPIYAGLHLHRDWLTSITKRAAKEGRYAEPAWVSGKVAEWYPEPTDAVSERWSSCTVRQGPKEPAAGLWLLALSLAVLGIRKR